MSADRLDPDDLAALTEAVAVRVVELLRDQPPAPTPRLLDAAQVAERLGVDRDYVYRHAAPLGGRRLGNGPRARLRFDAERVAAALSAFDSSKRAEPPAAAPQRRSRRRATSATADGIPLLPVRGARSAP